MTVKVAKTLGGISLLALKISQEGLISVNATRADDAHDYQWSISAVHRGPPPFAT